MVQINFALKEVNCKIVYYGPGMSGKTTNLEIVHEKAPESNKGELTSIATEGDRTLFFDFMPLDLGTIAGMRTRFQLYTVPGQVYYNSTRKLVLQGVDGIVFVADSSASKMEENLESLENLRNNLAEYGKDIRELPLVLQWNKRDLPDALPVEDLNQKLNHWGVPTFEAVAITGEGVFPTLKCLSGMVLETLNRDQRESPAAAPRPPQAAPVAAAQPAAAMGRTPTATATGRGPGGAGGGSRIRSGTTFDQMRAGGAVRTTGQQQAARSAGGATQRQWQPPRRTVEATPLESANIRAKAPAAVAGQRKLNIREEKSFPWLALVLGVLIIVAIGVILITTGMVGLPG